MNEDAEWREQVYEYSRMWPKTYVVVMWKHSIMIVEMKQSVAE